MDEQRKSARDVENRVHWPERQGSLLLTHKQAVRLVTRIVLLPGGLAAWRQDVAELHSFVGVGAADGVADVDVGSY